jgi:amino acid transporter
MRGSFVVGMAGIGAALVILLIAKSITMLTSISISAVSTNTEIRGGGAYFMISRVLGPEFGGAIGIALFAAQALSIPFYILGFTEALALSFPALGPYFLVITIATATLLFIISYVGAGWAIKTQYFIMLILGLSIIALLGGAAAAFSPEVFSENMSGGYALISGENAGNGGFSFWIVFAIFFPAVTGILAGVNMSGDLKDPAKSIPRGTLWSVAVGFVIYLAFIILVGGAFSRTDLVGKPFDVLKDNALFGMGFLVAAGVFAATLSSALGSCLGAPRILQAVSRDRILKPLRPFAAGSIKGDEPRRAAVLSFVITLAVLAWAGGDAGGGALNAVAAVITMFFLYTYGMINLAAFIEAFGRNPSFRPRFRFFHWVTALLGAIGCVGVAFLIDPVAAGIACLVITGLLLYIRTRQLKSAFGDARRGFVYSSVRRNLIRLASMEEDPKNWRPTILVFSGNPATREGLVTYAVWLESGRGIVLLANILIGSPEKFDQHRIAALKQLGNFCKERNIHAFPLVVVSDDIEHGALMLLQAASVGPIRPNLTAFGWKSDPNGLEKLVRYLRLSSKMQMSLVLLRQKDLTPPPGQKRIDVWWRGRKNGGLMVILAFLLSRNWEWTRSRIRIIRVVENEAGREPAEDALQDLIDKARVDATSHAIVSDKPFPEILHEQSADAACVFLGFECPETGEVYRWHAFYEKLLKNMPTTVLVSSFAGEDMLA